MTTQAFPSAHTPYPENPESGSISLETAKNHQENITLLTQRRQSLLREIQKMSPIPFRQMEQSEIQEKLVPHWQEFDFESVSIPPESQELFKTQAERSLFDINTFAVQIAHSPDLENIENDAMGQELLLGIQKYINTLWENHMKPLQIESPPSFQDFGEAMIETLSHKYDEQLDQIDEYLDNAEESALLEKTKNEFFAQGGTQEQWQEFLSSTGINTPLPPVLQKIKSDFLSQGKTEKEWNDVIEEYKTRQAKNQKEYESLQSNIKKNEAEKKLSIPSGEKYYTSAIGKVPLLERFDGTESTEDYIAITAESILNESHDHSESNPTPSYHFLTSGEPFYEVIQFLRNETNTMSPQAYQAMQSMLKGHNRTETHKKWVDKKVAKLSQYQSSSSDDPRHDKKSIKQKRLQQKIGTSDHLYQLAMHRIAQKAQQRIAGNETEVLGVDAQTVESLKKTAQADGYEVKNKHTEKADGTLSAQYAGRFTLENLVLDQVIRSAGILMMIANLLIAIKSKNWRDSLPYIGAGALMTGGLAQGVFNSGFDRMRYPDRMLNNIINESLNNEHYRMYFKNEWEVALLQSITWPQKQNKHEMKKDLRTLKKEKEVKTIDDNTTPDGKREITKLPGFLSPEGKIRNEMEQRLSISDFSRTTEQASSTKKKEKPGTMAKYLGEGPFLGPDGKMYPREQFLQKVEQHGIKNEHVRYRMFRNISGRIGNSSSFIPYFNQIHHYYAYHETGKTKAQHEEINHQLKTLSQTLT